MAPGRVAGLFAPSPWVCRLDLHLIGCHDLMPLRQVFFPLAWIRGLELPNLGCHSSLDQDNTWWPTQAGLKEHLVQTLDRPWQVAAKPSTS